jgi:hypothetical protein
MVVGADGGGVHADQLQVRLSTDPVFRRKISRQLKRANRCTSWRPSCGRPGSGCPRWTGPAMVSCSRGWGSAATTSTCDCRSSTCTRSPSRPGRQAANSTATRPSGGGSVAGRRRPAVVARAPLRRPLVFVDVVVDKESRSRGERPDIVLSELVLMVPPVQHAVTLSYTAPSGNARDYLPRRWEKHWFPPSVTGALRPLLRISETCTSTAFRRAARREGEMRSWHRARNGSGMGNLRAKPAADHHAA